MKHKTSGVANTRVAVEKVVSPPAPAQTAAISAARTDARENIAAPPARAAYSGGQKGEAGALNSSAASADSPENMGAAKADSPEISGAAKADMSKNSSAIQPGSGPDVKSDEAAAVENANGEFGHSARASGAASAGAGAPAAPHSAPAETQTHFKRRLAMYQPRVDYSRLSLKGFNLRRALGRLVSSLGAGWYSKGERASEDRARLLVLNYTANIIANLIGGSFFTGLLLLMNADDSFIGTMSMIGVAANMVQMFAPLLLERFKRRKPMLMVMRAVTMVINIVVIGLIPLAPLGQQAKLALVGVCVAVVNFVGAMAAPGITVWHIQSIPPRVRAGFFSLVTMTVGSVVAVFNLGGSALVDVFKAAGSEYAGLLTLRGIAFAISGLDLYLYSKIKEYPYESAGERFSLKDLVTLPLKNRIYLRTVAIVFLWNVTANIPGSYYTVYLLKNLNVSYTYIMIVNMINVPIVLLLTRVWSRFSGGRSPFKILWMGMSMYLLHYIGLSFVTPGTLFIYPLTLVWAFVMAIGINLPFASIPYVNMPKEHQTVYIGFYSTMANFAALIGVSIGKYFIAATEDLHINVLGFDMVNKQYLLLLTAGLMAIAVALIHRIDRTTPYTEG